MKILALDTSSPVISVAIVENGKPLAGIDRQGNASTLLAPAIDEALAQANMKLEAIDAFAIGEGPGSYNGLRCGFATLAGLLLARERPAVQVNSLAATALAGAQGAATCGVILNARKNMFFFQRFGMQDGLPRLMDESMVNRLDEIPGLEFKDTLWLSHEVEGFERAFPSATAVAKLAEPLFAGKPALGEPRYLRPPV